ncbi:MAG: hypothetical protein R2695_04235 [Acidimicrobiales bacterium]
MAAPVGAADLHEDHVGTRCGDGQIGTWHFVNVQTGGATEPGTLTASFDGGTAIIVVQSDQVNRRMQHFRVTGVGTVLDDASTDLPRPAGPVGLLLRGRSQEEVSTRRGGPGRAGAAAHR